MCNYCYTGATAKHDLPDGLYCRLNRQINDLLAANNALKNILQERQYEILDLYKQIAKLKQNNLTARLAVIGATEKLNTAAAIFGKPNV